MAEIDDIIVRDYQRWLWAQPGARAITIYQLNPGFAIEFLCQDERGCPGCSELPGQDCTCIVRSGLQVTESLAWAALVMAVANRKRMTA